MSALSPAESPAPSTPGPASPGLITDTATLAAFCQRLASAEFITVDTEFMRETTFWARLCLVQVGGPDEAHCIDPLAPGLDLAPLYALLANENVLKVFHAARQDLEIFLHESGRLPKPVFDTQVAAMVCGFGDQVGYETLVAKLANARLDKSQRFTDWSRRPLTDRQVKYALGDVTHLRKAFTALVHRLERTGRLSWLNEEMSLLTDERTYTIEPREAWRRIKARVRSPRMLAVLRELAAWREETARSLDWPRQRVAKDDALLELAAHPPESADDIKRARLAKPLAAERFVAAVLAAVRRGKEVPDADCPRLPAYDDQDQGPRATVELLKLLLKIESERHDVAARLIASSDDIEAIAVSDTADVPALHGWRREVFGEAALKLKHGKLAIGLSPTGKQVEVFER
ncbi:MAG: ribonuclease D [Rhodospirillaceae bacterium]|nr:ribonuclease D [Rhodospirillaceae bacterium]